MEGYYRYRRVCRIDGWTKWLPFLVTPFLVLSFEVWLHTQTRVHDYTLSQIKSELRGLQASVKELKARKAELEQMDNVLAEAVTLGLKPPTANQIKVVYLTEEGRLDEALEPIDLARLDIGGSASRSILGALQPLE